MSKIQKILSPYCVLGNILSAGGIPSEQDKDPALQGHLKYC